MPLPSATGKAFVLPELLPLIDVARDNGASVSHQLDAAFTHNGVCCVRGIVVDAASTAGVFEASRRFHAWPRRHPAAGAAHPRHLGCERG